MCAQDISEISGGERERGMKERARACVARSDGDDDTGRIIGGGKRDQYQKKSVKGKITSSIQMSMQLLHLGLI